jgi:predicted DNA-binding protein (UPF0251 family)
LAYANNEAQVPRPKKNRHVQYKPDALYFKPRAIPLRVLAETVLESDELEALRLADLEGCYHDEAARRMRISRQTFGNIVRSARKKVADALVRGKAIRLECGAGAAPGRYAFVCDDCGLTWEAAALAGRPGACPDCGSPNFLGSSAARPGELS